MPRAGGEADKLGNRYEAIWTVDTLLDLLAGRVVSVIIESLDEDEARGAEFITTLPDGTKEFHSVKWQKSGSEWSPASLCMASETGRSILGDLFEKQRRDAAARGVFVSSGAGTLLELWERTQRSPDHATFERQYQTSGRLSDQFTKIVAICEGRRDLAFEMLRRMRVDVINEHQLARRVDQKIEGMIYRLNEKDLDPREIRLLLGDIVLDRLGQVLDAESIWRELRASHGYGRKDWACDLVVQERVAGINQQYIRQINSDLINGRWLIRGEAQLACERLAGEDGPKTALIVGPAGRGKSCAAAQAASLLEGRGIPRLCLRADTWPQAMTSRALGREHLNLPASPAVVLAGIAGGRRCVLVLDQIDAISLVSGRNPDRWTILEALLHEASEYPNMRVLFVCRAFDLEHDPRLRGLVR